MSFENTSTDNNFMICLFDFERFSIESRFPFFFFFFLLTLYNIPLLKKYSVVESCRPKCLGIMKRRKKNIMPILVNYTDTVSQTAIYTFFQIMHWNFRHSFLYGGRAKMRVSFRIYLFTIVLKTKTKTSRLQSSNLSLFLSINTLRLFPSHFCPWEIPMAKVNKPSTDLEYHDSGNIMYCAIPSNFTSWIIVVQTRIC